MARTAGPCPRACFDGLNELGIYSESGAPHRPSTCRWLVHCDRSDLELGPIAGALALWAVLASLLASSSARSPITTAASFAVIGNIYLVTDSDVTALQTSGSAIVSTWCIPCVFPRPPLAAPISVPDSECEDQRSTLSPVPAPVPVPVPGASSSTIGHMPSIAPAHPRHSRRILLASAFTFRLPLSSIMRPISYRIRGEKSHTIGSRCPRTFTVPPSTSIGCPSGSSMRLEKSPRGTDLASGSRKAQHMAASSPGSTSPHPSREAPVPADTPCVGHLLAAY